MRYRVPRLIPNLLIDGGSLVKPCKFRKHVYIGDPLNTVKIFNELEVDEICIMDISLPDNLINYQLLEQIANQAFMPLSYGGGIKSIEDIEKLLKLGIEKVVLNSVLFDSPDLVTLAVKQFGTQAIAAHVEVVRNLFGRYIVTYKGTKKKTNMDAVSWVQKLEQLGVGEILLTDTKREGTWQGLNIELGSLVGNAVDVPVILNGGLKSVDDFIDGVSQKGIDAAASGSYVSFQKKGYGVLVNFPERAVLNEIWEKSAKVQARRSQ